MTEMSEHIMTFSKIDEDKYTNPKDKLEWKLEGENLDEQYQL